MVLWQVNYEEGSSIPRFPKRRDQHCDTGQTTTVYGWPWQLAIGNLSYKHPRAEQSSLNLLEASTRKVKEVQYIIFLRPYQVRSLQLLWSSQALQCVPFFCDWHADANNNCRNPEH